MGKRKPKPKDAPIDLFKDLGLGMASGIVPIEFLSTGRPALDWIMSGRFDGSGGMPVGRIMEVFGDPSTGKSWLAYTFIAQAQRAGYKCVLEDAEQSYTPALGALIGIDNSALGYRQIDATNDTVEDHFMLAERAFSANQPVFLVLDSLAALTTKEEKAKNFGERTVGSKARAVKEGLRKLTALINQSKSIYLVCNHVIHFIGMPMGAMKGTPGGGGFPFHSTTRLELSFRGKYKRGDNIVGVNARVLAKKSRATAPFKYASIVILFEEGVETQSGLLSVGQQLGVIPGKPVNGRWAYRGKTYLRSKLETILLDRLHEKGEL